MSADPRRGGFILVSVLGAMIVLAGLVAAVSYLVRTAVVGAANARERLVMDALSHAGVELAGYQLFTVRRPAAEVNAQRVRLDDGVVTLFVTAETGRIDLNRADLELLAGAWNAIGAPGMPPETFAARVVDYRDFDDEPSEKGGAEAPQYAEAGPGRAPANAPFEQVDDVQKVLGVSVAAARALAPLLTVYNPSGKVSVFDATPAVLRAIPGRGVAERIAAIRAKPPSEEADQSDALGDVAKFFTVERASRAYSVRVEVERNGARRVTDLVLLASPSADAAFYVADRRARPAG